MVRHEVRDDLVFQELPVLRCEHVCNSTKQNRDVRTQILEGAFLAASTPMFASKYTFFSIFRNLQENHLLASQFCKFLPKKIYFFPPKLSFFDKFGKTSLSGAYAYERVRVLVNSKVHFRHVTKMKAYVSRLSLFEHKRKGSFLSRGENEHLR